MLSRCFKDDAQASNDKLVRTPPPAFLSPRRWRKPTGPEVAIVTLATPTATA
jgi:hypothetical protein